MKINLIVIRTAQLKALADFYKRLGLKFEYHKHGNGPYHYSANIEGVIFEIYPLKKNQQQPDLSARLGFEVEDLDELIVDLKNNEVVIDKEPQSTAWGYTAVIQDLDGRKIELVESI